MFKIIKIDPNFADAYYNLGIIYKKLNKIELSILNYEICLKIKKDKYEAYNNLGNIYKDKNNVSEAVKISSMSRNKFKVLNCSTKFWSLFKIFVFQKN